MIAGIIGAISLASELFSEGKKAVEIITGAPSQAATPAGLQSEVEAMPPEQQAQWAKAMEQKIAMYKARNERLANEQGSVDAATLNAIPPEARAEVALMRMTTRPWAVRWCVRSLAWPPLAALTIDGILVLANLLARAFGWTARHSVIADGKIVGETVVPLQFDLMASALLADGSGFMTLYSWFAPTAASIVITYMTLREVGKARGHSDGPSVSELAGRVKNLIGNLT